MRNLIKNIRLPRTSSLLLRSTMAMTTIKPSNYNVNPQNSYLTSTLRSYMSTHTFHHKNVIKSSYDGPGYYVEQMLTGCLAIYSYYIESGDECFLIDPLFDTAQYN